MAHNRKIVLSGVSLTKARPNRHSIKVGPEVMDEIEGLILSTKYLNTAPFKWVGLSLRYGVKNEDVPHYQGIDAKDGEIAVAIELDTRELQYANREELKDFFMIATLKALVDIGKRYNLPQDRFQQMLDETQSRRAERSACELEDGGPG